MCDYSLHAVKTRPAKVDDKLTVRQFGWSTRGFAASEDKNVAVCLLPGTELSFTEEVRKIHSWPWSAPASWREAIGQTRCPKTRLSYSVLFVFFDLKTKEIGRF